MIVVQNYSFFEEKREYHPKMALMSTQPAKVEANEELNYYMLKLLIRIIN